MLEEGMRAGGSSVEVEWWSLVAMAWRGQQMNGVPDDGRTQGSRGEG